MWRGPFLASHVAIFYAAICWLSSILKSLRHLDDIYLFFINDRVSILFEDVRSVAKTRVTLGVRFRWYHTVDTPGLKKWLENV